jgi:uncharacterized protein (TIGR02611 family)
MESLKKRWYNVPTTVRKPTILLIGMFFVIISPFTGVLPGPGGIPVFLIGIAILSTEFEWAKRLRDWTIDKVQLLGRWWRAHKFVGTLAFTACFAIFASISFFAYRTFMR